MPYRRAPISRVMADTAHRPVSHSTSRTRSEWCQLFVDFGKITHAPQGADAYAGTGQALAQAADIEFDGVDCRRVVIEPEQPIGEGVLVHDPADTAEQYSQQAEF